MSSSGDLLLVEGALGFNRLGAEVPVAIPGDGILVVQTNQGSSITLATGTLRGIRYEYPDGSPVVLTTDETHVKSLRTAPGSTVTVVHNDTVNVTTASERIIVSSQQDVLLDRGSTRLFFGYASPFSDFRWLLDDIELFAPTVEGDWVVTPSRFSAALNELAARASVVYSGTTAGAGEFTVVYPMPYANIPHVDPQLVGGTNNPHQFIRLTSSTVSGFTVTAYESTIVNVLGVDLVSGTPTTVNGLSITAAVHPVL